MTLEARALAIGFGTRVVAAPIDFVLRAGEITCLLGPNGGGKTTLLRTLLGALPPRAGDVLLDDRPLSSWRPRERAQRLAYVPQATASEFDFTLLEMVEMGRTPMLGVFAGPRTRDRLAALEALDRLGIAHLAGRPIGAVSGGERQLAYIARALVTQASHVLMDEPTASLDFGNQALILDQVSRLARNGTAVLLATHHPDHALRIADRAVLLGGGRLLAAGSAAAILNSENLSALYGRAVEVAQVPSTDGPPGRFCIVREPGRFD